MSHFDHLLVRSRIGSPLTIAILVLSGMIGLFSLSMPMEASGITVSGGELIGNTHWTISDSPVDILDNVTIPAGSTLTIDPGVTVTLPPSVWIEVEGSIWAAGTETASIDIHRSHSSFEYDGINITNGGYGYLDHIEMSGSAGGIKAQGMTTRAFVYNSTLEGNAAGFRGQSGAFAWVVNCTFNAPLNATAQSNAEVHEGKWFHFQAVKDINGDPVRGVGIKVDGEKYPTELDEWTIYNSLVTGEVTGVDGWMAPVPVNQYKHMGSTSFVHVEVTMEWFFQNESSSWDEDITDPGLFVGDNFEIIWEMDWTPPPEPVNFTVGNRTGDSIELHWDIIDPPKDLKRFTIFYKKSFEGDWTDIRYAGYNKRSYIADGLDEETEYLFQIRAEDPHPVYSEFVGPVRAKTLDVTPPKPVGNFRVENVGADWAALRWDASPSNDIIGFWLEIVKKDLSWNNSYWIDGRTTLKANITGIDSETDYVANITPIDDGEFPNVGNTSDPIEFRTLDNTPPPVPMLEFFPLDVDHFIPGTPYFNTQLVGFKVNVTGEDRTIIEILLDGLEFVDPDGVIEKWTTYDGVFQYYFFLDEGRHYARFRSIDPSGNIGEFNQTDIWVDLTPPEMNIENVTGDEIHFFLGETVDLSLNVSDINGVHSVMWNVSNDEIHEVVEGTELSMNLGVGVYNLSVMAYDIAGNWRILSYKLNITIKDIVPPVVFSITPSNGDTDVSIGPEINISFSEPINWERLEPSLGPDGGELVDLGFDLDEGTNTIIYYPQTDLDNNTEYVFVLGEIFDMAGNQGENIVIRFTTLGITDIDKDGIPDQYELDHSNVLSPADPNDAGLDFDNDGLTNLEEYQYGTEPDNPDTDGDKIPDGKEVEWGLRPLWPSDANGDLDEDDYSNLEEYERGSDPLDPKSVPEAEEGSILPYIIILVLIVVLILTVMVIFVIIIMKRRKDEEIREEEERKTSEEMPEEPTWAQQEDEFKKECPFCSAGLDIDMSYCPECGMTLPEEDLDEDSMDEDLVEGSDEAPLSMEDEIGSGDIMPPTPDLPEPEDDLPPGTDEGIEPPSMDDDII